MELKVINISVKNAIMSREFYWNLMGIDCFNQALSNARPNKPQNYQIFAPQMPLNSQPQHIVLDVKNLSMADDKELKVFKQLPCDCSLKCNRMRRERRNFSCPHKNVADIRPVASRVKAENSIQLEMIFRYELLGQHEISFNIVSSSCTLKLKLIVVTVEFNPLTMLLTNKLTPVAIDNFPAAQQALWLYNPYSSDIQLKLISYDVKLLAFVNDVIVVKSHEHSPAFLKFSPNHVGFFKIRIGLLFNECECNAIIHAECNEHNMTSIPHFSSPNNALPSQLNPFVLHSDNLYISLPQNGICNENLISLQNCSKHCIKYEWKNLYLSKNSVEILIEPPNGYLKAGFTKLFRVTVRSLGCELKLKLIPLECSIFRYNEEIFREYLLPHGYFEYTDKGYYEKPKNWSSPKCFELLHTLYANINVTVFNAREFMKYSDDAAAMIQTTSIYNENSSLNVPMTTTNNDDDDDDETASTYDEKYMMETLISMTMSGAKYEQQKRILNSRMSYLEMFSGDSSRSTEIHQHKRLIPTVMNDILFDCITEISKEHRFISSTF